MSDAPDAPAPEAAVRHGSRWLHSQPSEAQVTEWFKKQSLHDGMDHDPYLGGIVLIGATEKLKVTKRKQNGDTFVGEMEQAVFVPYVKVDTRIAYFHAYTLHLNGGDPGGKYAARIRPVPQRLIEDPASSYYNAHLPEGFSVLPVRNSNDSVSRFVVATFDAAIVERESPDKVPILQGRGTKQVALARNWADDNALMKGETGAIGRALGAAGILVVGTGVATAEDMQEALAGPAGAGAASAEGAVLPSDAPVAPADGPAVPPQGDVGAALPLTEAETDEELRQRALALQAQIEADHPEAWEAYRAWWKERGFGHLAELGGPALRGAVVKLERDLDQAKANNITL